MQNQENSSQNESIEPGAFPDMMQPNLVMATSMLTPLLSANIALLNWNAKNCERLAQGYKQWFDFVGHRLEEDASLASQVQSAKDPQEVAQACSNYVEKAAKDYQDEFSQLTKLSGDMSNDATDAMRDMSSDATDAMQDMSNDAADAMQDMR